MSERTNGCSEVLEDLASLVDGDEAALKKHADHLADCDSCRDRKHDATEAAGRVERAGDDFVAPDDLEERLLGALDAREKDEPAPERSAEPKEAPAEHTDPEGATVLPMPVRKDAERAPVTRRVRWWQVAAAAAVLAGITVAGTVGLFLAGVGGSGPSPAAERWTTARVTRIVRASDSGATVVEVREAGSSRFAAAGAGTTLAAGSTVRTDDRTRARLALADGSTLVLDRSTEIALDGSTPRLVRLSGGEVVAEVSHVPNAPPAVFSVPTGRVEVLGTKLVLAATDDVASVRVVRGTVRIHGAWGDAVEVQAGQEGLLPKSGGASVTPAVNLAGSVSWSELEVADDVESIPAGIGQLRARRPGEREEQERPLELARHRVTVRIVGNVARTEIEEVFRNDGSHTLEGIYSFPLPPHAQIARLALDVDGRMEEGAFVERDRAAKIWRGVIRNATPRTKRDPKEDIIWVPGPWRDPALLEWQQGGRFELKIFPIPARGERRVVLAYTETIPPHGNGRRYVYPLAQSADGSTRVGRFDADIRVAGADRRAPLVAHGYPMQMAREGEASRLTYSADGFVPAGDIIVDFSQPNANAELLAWTYRSDAAPAPTAAPARRRPGGNRNVAEEQASLTADDRPFVAFALRPELPPWTEVRQRDYVVVVDSSQSMFGESFSRASRLVTSLVAEMDRRDRFLLLACDVTCRSMEVNARTPSAAAATEAAAWLDGIRPAGASDLAGALATAAHALDGKRSGGREVRVVYVGDGLASVGFRRAGSIAAEAESIAEDAHVVLTTVGIGGEADAMTLAAIARAGAGHYVRYMPGERASAAALAVLETTYGSSLADARLELPPGIVDVSPERLPTIRAGEEVIVTGRLTGDVRGEVVLRGTVGGRPYLDRYPVSLTASTAAGNAFVPRLWAAETIRALELDGKSSDETRIVALSKTFGVLSRHTSLLVLESEAMFRAFGVERTTAVADWSGDEDMETNESTGAVAQGTTSEAGEIGSGVMGGYGRGGGGFAAKAPSARRESARADDLDALLDRSAQSRAAPRPAPGPTPVEMERPRDEPVGRRRMPGRWMRRVWYRVGEVQRTTEIPTSELRAVASAEEELRQEPDSRDKHRDLVRALARAGELDRAREVAEKWLGRDPLDAEALTYLSDVLGRQGDRDEAVRLLTGIVDLDPESRLLQERLANAFERSGDADRACTHRVALAEIAESDAARIGAAVRCQRERGKQDSAERLLGLVEDEGVRRRAVEVAARVPAAERVRGEIVLDASWTSGVDLDVSLVTPQGTRLSWMGGRTTVVGDSARTSGRERLALRRATPGSYWIEVNRTRRGDTTPVFGQIRVRALGSNRTLDFSLMGERTTVGRIVVRREFRLEQVFR